MFHCTKNANEFMGASTSERLRAAVVPPKVLTIPDTVPIRKVVTVPVSTSIQNSLHMVYEGGSKGCRKRYGPLYSVFPTSNEPDRPAAAKLCTLKRDDDIAY